MNSSIMRMNLLDLPRVHLFPVFQTTLLAPKAQCSVEEDKLPPDMGASINLSVAVENETVFQIWIVREGKKI